jgi:hypothetical protein
MIVREHARAVTARAVPSALSQGVFVCECTLAHVAQPRHSALAQAPQANAHGLQQLGHVLGVGERIRQNDPPQKLRDQVRAAVPHGHYGSEHEVEQHEKPV